jgi:HEAT repeat protein
MVLLSTACVKVEDDMPLDELIASSREGDESAIRGLVDRFAHPDPEVSLAAWEAAVELGSVTEKALIDALSSKNRTVAEHAAGALGSVGSQAAVEPLMTALGSWKSRRYVVAWALGEIGDPVAIPVLVDAMGDEDGEVRKFAARSMIKFGHKATDALLKALENPSTDIRHYAVRALGEIRDPHAVDALLGMDDEVDREVHLWALGRLGDRRGFSVIADSVDSDELNVRLAAIQALKDLGDERAVPLLTAALEDPKWMVREWAARGLESITGNRCRYRDQNGEEVYPYDLYR